MGDISQRVGWNMRQCKLEQEILSTNYESD